MRIALATVLAAFAGLQALGAYEVGDDLLDASFWKSDPVLFVRKHVDEGFQFTSDAREGADSRQDGAVTCFGVPVFETRVAFAEEGGIERLELVLFNTGGTETMREFEGEDGKKFRQRTRVEKTISREAFFKALADVRARLTVGKAKAPKVVSERLKNQTSIQKSQAWPKSAIGTCAKLTWNYSQDGRADPRGAGCGEMPDDRARGEARRRGLSGGPEGEVRPRVRREGGRGSTSRIRGGGL